MKGLWWLPHLGMSEEEFTARYANVTAGIVVLFVIVQQHTLCEYICQVAIFKKTSDKLWKGASLWWMPFSKLIPVRPHPAPQWLVGKLVKRRQRLNTKLAASSKRTYFFLHWRGGKKTGYIWGHVCVVFLGVDYHVWIPFCTSASLICG